MSFSLSIFNTSMSTRKVVTELIENNSLTEQYGLKLTLEDAKALVATRTYALTANDRVEFGSGTIKKIITAFCDSPYLSSYNYVDSLHELIEIFYFYKNESMDLISDDTLIDYMKEKFDNPCHGSLELLAGRELDRMAHNLKYGYPLD